MPVIFITQETQDTLKYIRRKLAMERNGEVSYDKVIRHLLKGRERQLMKKTTKGRGKR